MNERDKPDLSTIEPIGKAPDPDDGEVRREADRVGGAEAITMNTPPAVGVDDEVTRRESEPLTSPETEHELERLRRG